MWRHNDGPVDEIKRNPDLCVRIGQERDGGELFEARVAK